MTEQLLDATDRLEEYLDLFVHIRTVDLARIDHLVHPEIRFRDPFNDLTGRDAFRRLLRVTREDVGEPEFRVLERWWNDGGSLVVKWYFAGRLPVIGRVGFTGLSELEPDAQGGDAVDPLPVGGGEGSQLGGGLLLASPQAFFERVDGEAGAEG